MTCNRVQKMQLLLVTLTPLLLVIYCPIQIAAQIAPDIETESQLDPPPSIDQVLAALEDSDLAIALLDKLPKVTEASDLARLRELDRRLSANAFVDRDPIARKLLSVLVNAGDARSLGYLHEVFETAPERRHHVAQEIAKFAMTNRRRPADWRLLVRAVPFVEGDVARDVLRALQRFNERGTKPQWQRQVILAGLRLGAPDDQEAVCVLRHWTGKTIDKGTTAEDALAAWQAWFDVAHTDLPPPTLPIDSTDNRHSAADLFELLAASRLLGDPQRGAKIVEKAQCLKCHRYGSRGEPMGPDITNVRQRFQLKELVEAIVFPSQTLSDQYTTVTILTRDGKTFSGVTAAEGNQLVILQANGEKVRIDRNAIDQAVPSRKSAMPDGLLNALTREEIVDLFAFLRRSER